MLFIRHHNNMDLCYRVRSTPSLSQPLGKPKGWVMLVDIWHVDWLKPIGMTTEMIFIPLAKSYAWYAYESDGRPASLDEVDWLPMRGVLCRENP